MYNEDCKNEEKNFINSLNKLVISHNSRLDWDEYFMSMTLLISTRSGCDRLHVGCIIVKNQRVISSGYNGFLKGLPHESVVVDNHEQATVHAEQNAISDAAQRGVSLNNSEAYITHYPCITCCKLLIATGIKKIKYLNNYKNSNIVERIFSQSKMSVEKLPYLE